MKTFVNSHKAVQQFFAALAIVALVFTSAPLVFASHTVTTSTTLNPINSPLSPGQTGVAWSGYVAGFADDEPIQPPNNASVHLQLSSVSCETGFSTIDTGSLGNPDPNVPGDQRAWADTFSAPANAGTYYLRASFPGASQGSHTWSGSVSDCQVITVAAVPEPGSITIVKEVAGESAPAEWSFDFTTELGNFSLSNTSDTEVFSELEPDTYVITEDTPLPEGWSLSDISCEPVDSDSEVTVDDNELTIELAEGDDLTCTFTNTYTPADPGSGSLTILKETDAEAGLTTEFDFELDSEAFPDTILGNNADYETFSDLSVGSHTVTELSESGWDFGSVSCDVDSEEGTKWSVEGTTLTVDIADGDDITCTFSNTLELVDDTTVTVIKQTIPDGDQTEFDFYFSDAEVPFASLSDGESSGEQEVSDETTVIINEDTPEGWTLTDVTCVNELQQEVGAWDGSVYLNLDAGDDVTCTFTNTQDDDTTITVIKQTIPDGSETGFNFYFGNAEEAFANLSDGESETESVEPGEVVIREGMIEDWILTDVSCEDEAENEVQGSLEGNELTLTVDEGDDITCTFTNTFDGEVPEVPACTVDENLLLNGSFEDPDVVDNQWNIFTVVPNWIMSWVDDAVSATPSLELHGGVNGWLSFAGVQHAELDGDQEGPAGANAPGTESASTRIEQTVAGIVPGATYELSYRFSPRPDTGESENAVEAYANGELVDSVSADGSALANTDWQLRTTEFVATSSSLIVALQDAGTSNSVGTFVDDVRLCLVEEPVVNQCSVTAVSDTTNTVVVEGDDTNAELVTFIHPNWDEVIDGASWIWSEDPLTDAVNATTATFEKTFTFDGPVTSTELEIASDNTYEVYLNGNLIGSDISGGTFTNKDVYTNFNGFVVQGVNTLRVEVLNFADEDGTPESNPAGLLYKLTVTGSDETCGTLPDDGDDDDDDDNGGGGNGRKIELTGGGDDDEDEPEGEVLGAQTEILPAGAPNAGMGGAAAAAQGTTSLFALISLIASALFARKFTN